MTRERRILGPEGSEIAPTSKPQPHGTLVEARAGVALAADARWRRLQLGQRDRRCRERLEELREPDRPARAAAPDIVEAILEGRADQALILGEFERPLRARWEEQVGRLSVYPLGDLTEGS
jgi:hypothetical protein